MTYQATFQRYETKYLLTMRQRDEMLKMINAHMSLDDYGHTLIRNLYFDTDTFRLIRQSLEKPCYKEKLRIRSYQAPASEDPVFVELKKKYHSVVYKRRLILPQAQAMDSFLKNQPLPVSSQIADEIEYLRWFYGELRPRVFLSYERDAFYALDGGDFRVTMDHNILYRQHDLSLSSAVYGFPLLPAGYTLMELKTSGGFPMWMSHALNQLRIYKISFSKYGQAYRHMASSTENQCLGRIQYAG